MIINEEVIFTVFALAVCLLSAFTVIILILFEASSKHRSYSMIALLIIALFVLSWFSAGFIAILSGVAINTAFYFRGMLSVLICLFTGSLVFVYRSKSCMVTNDYLKNIIIELRSKIREYEQD